MTLQDIYQKAIGVAQQGFFNAGLNQQEGRNHLPVLPLGYKEQQERAQLESAQRDYIAQLKGMERKLDEAIAYELGPKFERETAEQGWQDIDFDKALTVKVPGTTPEPTMAPEMGALPQPPAPTPTPANPTFDEVLQYTYDKALREGIHPAGPMSQGAVESDRMNSNFAKTRNNLFGIGSFDSNLGNTWKFEHPFQSVDAYFDLIKNDPRYVKAYENRQDPLRYIQEIKNAGYATDPNYVDTVTNTPEWRMGIEATKSGQLW
jgi:hypothetical protein